MFFFFSTYLHYMEDVFASHDATMLEKVVLCEELFYVQKFKTSERQKMRIWGINKGTLTFEHVTCPQLFSCSPRSLTTTRSCRRDLSFLQVVPISSVSHHLPMFLVSTWSLFPFVQWKNKDSWQTRKENMCHHMFY